MGKQRDLSQAREAIRAFAAHHARTGVVAPVAPPREPLRARFLAFDDRLAELGVPPLTQWWRDGLGRWLDAYESRHVVELYACVGRGAAKSTALYKLAMFFALEVEFTVPPGERHYAVIISARVDDATKGIHYIAAWLTLLGVAHNPHGPRVDLIERRVGFYVVACNVRAASGPRAFFLGKDERSKWADSGLSTEDADEVDTSSGAMTTTHEFAPIVATGSAWLAGGSFYDAIRLGTTDTRAVLGPAATWVAAPHISEESTHRKERNPARWRREYACEFTETQDEGLYTAGMLDAATRALGDVPRETGVTYVAAQDVGYVRNAWTFVIAALRRVNGRVKRSVVLAREWQGSADVPNDATKVLAEIAGYCKLYGVTVVESDAYERFALTEIARRPEIRLHLNIYDHGPIAARYEALLTWLVDGEVEIPADNVLRRDLLSVRQRFTSVGTTIHLPQMPDGRHCDYAPAVTLALGACVVAPDESVLLTADERVEKAALEADMAMYAPKKDRRGQRSWMAQDPLAKLGYDGTVGGTHGRGRRRY